MCRGLLGSLDVEVSYYHVTAILSLVSGSGSSASTHQCMPRSTKSI